MFFVPCSTFLLAPETPRIRGRDNLGEKNKLLLFHFAHVLKTRPQQEDAGDMTRLAEKHEAI